MRSLITLLVCALCTACGAHQPQILASTPAPDSKAKQVSFSTPASEVNFNEITQTDWSPAVIGPNGPAMLKEALSQKKSIMVIAGGKIHSATFEDKLFQMIKATSPETKIVARNKGVLDKILVERGEIPYRRSWDVGGADVLGRPYMVPKDHPLQTDWLNKKTELKGAEAIMLIDYITPDTQKLRQMRDSMSGGCTQLTNEIDSSISNSYSHFEAFQTEVNAALKEEFQRQLNTALPFWKDELNNFISAIPNARCEKAYLKFLTAYDDCADATCPLLPQLFIQGSGVIGMEMSNSAIIPTECPTPNGRDYVSEMAGLGKKATASVLDALPKEWAADFARVEALEKVKSKIEDVCAPAHRRYVQSDLESAKQTVAKSLSELSTLNLQSEWSIAEGKERVSKVGSVTVFAKAKSKNSALSNTLSQLDEAFKPLYKCRDSKRRPVQVVLVDVNTSEVYFSTIVFEEQLFCEDMGL